MRRPGVMIKDVFRRLTMKPVTSKYPFEKSPAEPGYRGAIVFDNEKCVSCGMCARDCPSFACVMETIDGKKRPVFYLDKCMFCSQCVESCPKDAISMSQEYELAHLKGNPPIVK